MTGRTACPACFGMRLADIYYLPSIPVQSCVLLDTLEEALAFPRAPLLLRACDDCGFIFNALFDAEQVDYALNTEESQHFSGTFNRFGRELIEDIAARYDISGKQTLEIGCGKGEFLLALVERTGTCGVGVDPGFVKERLADADDPRLTYLKEYFDPASIPFPPDFVVCRHTLEHIPEVGRFMSEVARLVEGREDTALFFETPDVRRVLEEGAFWDIYYEHCSYFTLGSHARLFRRSGLGVTRLYLAYDDQYIIQYAQPGPTHAAPEEHDLVETRALCQAFPERVAERRDYWRSFVEQRHAEGRRVAIWGGGSKGVSFLTSNGLEQRVADVVDVNPHKQGKFLPGSGHRVVGPDTLRSSRPDTVIVMNPIYVPEIAAELGALGLSPEVVAV